MSPTGEADDAATGPDRSADAESRVFLAGDWHGNREWAASCYRLAAEHGCPVILQLGDFGLWPGRAEAWLDHVERLGRDYGVRLVWIDGNHENHDDLDRWRRFADGDGLVGMRDGVHWATRGSRWRWGGRRFGALGGAVSLDRFLRREGVNWWPAEAVTRQDVERLGDGPLDVLVTHAAPARVPFPPVRPLRLPGGVIEDTIRVRNLLDEALTRTGAGLVVHGHHHRRQRVHLDGVAAEGLAHDGAGSPDAWAVLDLGSTLRIWP